MSRDKIKKVLQKMCIDIFGKQAIVEWNIDQMAADIETMAQQYKVEAKLCLAQGILESHFCVNPAASRSRKTKNIFNVGNVDDGGNRFFSSYRAGMDVYFRLMAREYCYRNEGDTVTVAMMIRHDFIRPRGGRYATAASYTKDVAVIVARIDKLTKQ